MTLTVKLRRLSTIRGIKDKVVRDLALEAASRRLRT
jgi:hypothetical protein